MNPNPEAKLTDFSREQLELMWKALEALNALGVFQDQSDDIELLKVQIMNAEITVMQREKVNQN